MQIERIYKPDIRYQMRAVMLMLRIRPPYEPDMPIPGQKEQGEQQATPPTSKRVRRKKSS